MGRRPLGVVTSVEQGGCATETPEGDQQPSGDIHRKEGLGRHLCFARGAGVESKLNVGESGSAICVCVYLQSNGQPAATWNQEE